jgi:hypothetical protein
MTEEDAIEFPELSRADLEALRAEGMTDEEIEAGLAVMAFAALPEHEQLSMVTRPTPGPAKPAKRT